MAKEIIKNVFHYFFAAINGIVALLLIVAAFSDRISPEKSMIFSWLGLIFPFICLVNFCFVIYWLILGKWKFLMIGLVTFLICWGSVRKYFPFHFRKEIVKTEDVIKVLSYNVMGFAYKEHTEDSPNKIIQYIANSGADIVCMQEYFVRKSGKRGLTSATVQQALSMYPYRSVMELKTPGWGLAVYSKFPISNSRLIKYDSKHNGSAIHEIEINGKTLTLVNNHLESFKLTTEDKSRYSDFIKGIGPDTFDGLKGTIQQKLGPAYLIRAKQARIITKEIKNAQSDYTLVCGDFNDTPISYAHRLILGSLKDAFAESGRGIGVTYNQNYFWFRIDNIFHSSNMQSMNCTVDKVKYSDHYPIWCYLKLQ